MRYYPEDHHKKPKLEHPVIEDKLSKSEVQLLQKQLDTDLETLNEQLEAFVTKLEPTQLDHAIIQEQIAHIQKLIFSDESFHVHIQEQIERLHRYEEAFKTLA